jgi:hypothetical protein
MLFRWRSQEVGKNHHGLKKVVKQQFIARNFFELMDLPL